MDAFSPNVPIYLQLMDEMKRMVLSGEWPPGQKIPAVRDLALTFTVNPNTMQRALSELEHDGFVTTNRTAGRTVTTDEGLVTRMKESIAKKSIEKFIKEMAAIGYSADDVVKMIKERGEEDK